MKPVRSLTSHPFIQRLNKAALLPLLLPLLAYIGAEYYLHSSLNRALVQVQQLLPAGSRFQYQDLSADFDGQLTLEGAELLLPGMNQPLKFTQLQLQTEGWGELLDQADAIEQGQLPSSSQIRFSLDDHSLDHLAFAHLIPRLQLRGLLGCLSKPAASASANSTPVSVFDGLLDYQFNPETHYLNLAFQLDGSEHYRAELKADLDVGDSTLRLSNLTAERVGLGGAQLTMANQGFQTALLEECGAMGRSGLIQGEYVARQSRLLRHSLAQHGWHVSNSLELAYQDYLFLPVELRLQWQSRESVPLQQLSQPQGWREFSTRVGLNRFDSGLKDLDWREPVLVAKNDEEAADTMAEAPLMAADQIPLVGLLPVSDVSIQESAIDAQTDSSSEQPITASPTPSYRPGYKRVSIPELKSLLGSPLKLTTRNGRRIEGVLDSIERNRLQLRREVAGGVAMVPVRIDSIEQLSAYF